jgi:hypothetical protein
MKYPWVAISLVIIWFATTYIILKRANMNVSYILLVALAGTIFISLIGFRAPQIRK